MMEAHAHPQGRSASKPRRTIRVALWGGEEQGLLGSRAYVSEHFADPATMALKPEHAKAGGLLQLGQRHRPGARHLAPGQPGGRRRSSSSGWSRWPISASSPLGPRSVASTDHASFDAVGLPGFQFMVDRLEYNSRTHHSNMDVYDRVQRDDMVQQATVVAVFAYNAAMRDEKLPRKPLPEAHASARHGP